MESFSSVSPWSAMACFTTPSTDSSVAQIGHRLSNTPSSPSAPTVSILKARVRAPDSSSSMLIPAAFPQVSPCGKSFSRFFTISIWGHSAKGRRVRYTSRPVRAFFPSWGVDAWAPSPWAVTVITGKSPSSTKEIPVSFSTASAAASNVLRSRPSTTALALPGTTLAFIPASTFTSLGIASEAWKDAWK